MLRLTVILTIVTFCVCCLGQQHSYLERARVFTNTNPDSAYILTSIAVKSAVQNKDTIEAVEALLFKQQLSLMLGMRDSAMSTLQQLRSETEKINKDTLRNNYISKQLSMEARIYFDEGNNHKADSCYQKAIELSSAYGFLRIGMVARINQGLLKRSDGNLFNAYECYNKALSLSDSIGDYDMRFSILCMIGQVQCEAGNPDTGIKYFEQAGEIKDSASYIGYVSEWKSDLGYAWFIKNELDSSLCYYQQANNIALKNQLPLFEALATINMGEVYLKKGELPKAKQHILKGLQLAEKMHVLYMKFYALSLMGEYYHMAKDYPKAQRHFNDAEAMIKKLDVIVELQKRHYERVYEFNKAIGNHKNALNAYEKFKNAEQAILGKETAWKVSRLEKTLDVAQKEKLILDQEQELAANQYRLRLYKSQSLTYLMIAFSLTLLLVSIIIISRTKRQKDKQVYKAEVDKVITGYKLKNIQTQISPHFIFNALNNLWGVFKIKGEEPAYNYLIRLSDLLRTTLTHSDNVTITLKEEIEFARNFLELERICNEEKFSYSIDIDGEVDLDLPVIPMCVQTHVENALKHGIKPKPTSGKLSIAIKTDGNHLVTVIEDNGIGRESAKKQNIPSTGVGLRSQQEMMDLYNRNNENKMILDIIDLKEPEHKHTGTRVEIKIPVKYSYSLN